MHNLHMMHVLHLPSTRLVHLEEQDELHQQLLDLLIELLQLLTIVSSLPHILQQVILCYYLCQNVLDALVVGIDQVVAAELERNVQDLVCYQHIFLGKKDTIVFEV